MSNITKRIGWTILLCAYIIALVVLYKGVDGAMSEIIAFYAIAIACIPLILFFIMSQLRKPGDRRSRRWVVHMANYRNV